MEELNNLTSIKVIIMLNGTDVPVYEEFITGNFTIGTLGAGLYKITIINTENENYTMFNASALFSVYKASSFVNITDVVGGVYNTTNVSVIVSVVNQTVVSFVVGNSSGNFTVNVTVSLHDAETVKSKDISYDAF